MFLHPIIQLRKKLKIILLIFFLNNPGERPANPLFGGGLRNFIFEQISFENLDILKEDINTKLQQFFPDVVINEVEVIGNEDQNEVVVNLQYAVSNTGIEDELNLSFQ